MSMILMRSLLAKRQKISLKDALGPASLWGVDRYGIFYYMFQNTSIITDFSFSSGDYEKLDNMYYLHSGDKGFSSKFLDDLKVKYMYDVNIIGAGYDLNDYGDWLYRNLSDVDYKNVMGGYKDYIKPITPFTNNLKDYAILIYNKYKLSWLKQYDAINTDYEPLENYSMVENEKIAEREDYHNEANTNISNSISDSTVDNYVNGFNSSTQQHTSQTADASTNTQTGDAEDNYSDGYREKTKANNDRDLTRSGNIGVTTSQQMLESELQLREKYNIFNQFFKDIDKELFNLSL